MKISSLKGFVGRKEEIKAIKGLKISEIGFASASGFEEKLDNVSYLELNDLFAIKLINDNSN